MMHVGRRPASARRARGWFAALLVGAAACLPSAAGAVSSPSPSGSAAITGPTASKAQQRATFGVQPATGTVPDQRPFFDFGLAPLSKVNDHIAIVNYSKIPLTLAVYATDALNSAEGGFGLKPAATKPTDAGTWISIGRSIRSVRVPAANSSAPGRVILPVTINVPGNAQPGDHAAGIVASLNTLGKNPQGQNVRLEQRVASRVYLRIAGDLKPALTITALHTRYHAGSKPWLPGTMDVSYVANNTGNVRLGFAPSLDLHGPGGVLSQHQDGQVFPELLPGNAHLITTTVKNVWPTFRVSTKVTLRSIAAPGAEAPKLGNVTQTSSSIVIPWFLLLLALLLGLAIWQLRRRRRRASGSSGGGPRDTADDPSSGPRGLRRASAKELAVPPSKVSR